MKIDLKIVAAFLITTIAITAMMPSGDNFIFTPRVGAEWDRASLVAQFDFSITKSEQEQEREASEIEHNFVPIYRYDVQLANMVKRSFVQSHDTLSSDDFKQLYHALCEIYDGGVLPQEQRLVTYRDSISGLMLLRVVRAGEISTLATSNLYTPTQALERFASVAEQLKISSIDADEYIVTNIIYDRQLSSRDLSDRVEGIAPIKDFVDKGTVLVHEGQVIDPHTYNVLSSYVDELKYKGTGSSSLMIILGNFVFVVIILVLTYYFLFQFRKGVSSRHSNVYFILAIFVAMSFAMYVVSKFDFLSVYVIPFAIVPIYIVTFYDIRMSIFEYFSVLLVCSAMAPYPFEFFAVNAMAGLSGVFVLQKSYSRHKLFVAMGLIYVIYIVSYYTVAFMQHNLSDTNSWYVPMWFAVNVMLLMVLYQSVYLIEKIFGFVTNITLLELCDTNNRLLRELAERAPGTFQHSMQVASLAEEAAAKIGANPLLARTGALYHDIGKSENPFFFIENVSNKLNPHLKITPRESAEIIKRHVTDGVQLAKKANLPQVIIDFIISHHGTSFISFFYHKQKQLTPNMDREQREHFRYDGMTPRSKEASICMMADVVEAASRSMSNRPIEEILEVVDKVIDRQISEKQFANSLLSFTELTTIKEVFKLKLASIHHTRIVYPE